ncbi:MAG: hypothetical protein ACTSRG_14045 [Candidatus Helarchaeota archaeon]
MGKLSGFKKMIGSLGKRIFNWKEEKYPINILAVMMEAVVSEYASIHDGDYVAALRNLNEFLGPGGEELVNSMLLDPIVMGMAFKSFMTDDLEDLPWLVQTSMWSLFGKKGYKRIFGGDKGIYLLSASKSEEGVPTIVMNFQKCPFCCNVQITKDELQNEGYGKILEVLFGKMVDVIQESVGNDYKVICKETKCFLLGDDIGEYRIWLYPKEDFSEKILQNPFLKDSEIFNESE